METKPKNKHERNKAKALARSKRNSPGAEQTKQQIKEARFARRSRRKFHQAMPRITKKMQEVMPAFKNVGTAATAAGITTKALVNVIEKQRAAEAQHREELEGKSRSELNNIAKSMGLKRYTLHNKGGVIEMILAAS